MVDDDRLVRAAMVRVLKKQPGITMEDFASGDQALLRAAKAHFDVAVLDLSMPVMDGVELAEKLRVIAPALRILFVTADPFSDLARRAQVLKPLAILPKPWPPDELARLLRS